MKYITADLKRPVPLGRRGENAATTIRFPINVFFPGFEAATYHLTHTRQGDTEPYPCATEVIDGNIEWVILRPDVARPGSGVLQLTAIANIDGDIIDKSVILTSHTAPSVGQEGEMPEVYQAWVDTLASYAARAELGAEVSEEAAEAAAASAEAAEAAAASVEGIDELAAAVAENAAAVAENAEAVAENAEEVAEVAPFYAEYGVTTKAEIAAAINGKRQIYAYQSLSPYSPILPYVGKIHYADEHGSGTGYRFALTEGRYLTIFELMSSWNYRSVDLEAPAQRAEAAASQALIRMNSAGASALAAEEAAPFYAEYGVTTRAEIEAAINDKRQIYLLTAPLVESTPQAYVMPLIEKFEYRYTDGGQIVIDRGYRFSITSGTNQYIAELANGWTVYTNDLSAPAASAEAYAIGKRNGTDVGSTDPAYHNNSKYYAEQAALIVDDVEQVMTSTTLGPTAFATFDASVADMPLKGLTVDIEPVQAEGTPSSENPLPISGWTTCKLHRTGVSLIGGDEFIGNTFSKTASGYKLSYNGSSIGNRASGYADIRGLPAGRYTIELLNPSYPAGVEVNIRRSTAGSTVTMGVIINADSAAGRRIYDIPENTTSLQLYIIPGTTSLNTSITMSDIVIVREGVESEPYKGNTYNITFPTEAGTVYGGTLDVVNRKLNSYPYYSSYNGETIIGPWISSMDVYTPGATPTLGAQVVDMGGAATSYDLSDIPDITTLLGENNIWANHGDVTVTYGAYLETVKAYADQAAGSAAGSAAAAEDAQEAAETAAQSVSQSAAQIGQNATDIAALQNAGFITGLEILSYGNSTWADFLAAYTANKVVYCRASSNSNPASGSQTRMAFMAFVNDAANPTNVEFQYYRSVSSHSDSQQGDQVFIYKLDQTAGWTVISRNTFSTVAAGDGLSKAYSNGTITLSKVDNAYTRNKDKDAMLAAAVRYGKETSNSKDFCILEVTDSHSDPVADQNSVLIANGFKYIDTLVHCGDICAEHATDFNSETYSQLIACQKPFYYVIGNHDVGNSYNVAECIDNATVYTRFIKPLVDAGLVLAGEYQTGKSYYYHDFTAKKIRLICVYEYDDPNDLSSVDSTRYRARRGSSVISQAQAEWFCDTLISTPSGYSVVVAIHSAFSKLAEADVAYKFTEASKSGADHTNRNFSTDLWADAVNAFVTRSSYTCDMVCTGESAYLNNPGTGKYYSFTKDFSSAVGSFLCFIGGHGHRDRIFVHPTYTYQKQVIAVCANTVNRGYAMYSDIRRTPEDSPSKDSLTAIGCDTANKKIRLVKIGVNVTENMTYRDFEMIDVAPATP